MLNLSPKLGMPLSQKTYHLADNVAVILVPAYRQTYREALTSLMLRRAESLG
jgi:hypothetical protein